MKKNPKEIIIKRNSNIWHPSFCIDLSSTCLIFEWPPVRFCGYELRLETHLHVFPGCHPSRLTPCWEGTLSCAYCVPLKVIIRSLFYLVAWPVDSFWPSRPVRLSLPS